MVANQFIHGFVAKCLLSALLKSQLAEALHEGYQKTNANENQCEEPTIRPPQEKNGECVCDHKDDSRGYLCSECVNKGVWGYGCDLPCPKNCKAGCDFIGNCKDCPENCERTKDGQCLNDRGECKRCKWGFAGIRCDQPCPKNCGPSPEGSCTRGGKCYSCMDGWYSDHCDWECPMSKGGIFPLCDRCTMKDGYVDGIFYEAGSCVEPCDGRYYGQDCDQQCPEGCDESKSPLCKRGSGECTACAPGFYGGPRCEHNCKDTNCADAKCADDGKCVAGCKEGFFGDFCDQACPEGCAGGCTEEGQCLVKDGCVDGRTGLKCERNCDPTCFACEQMKDDVCKKCHSDQPAELKEGKCVCITGAELDEQLRQCVCSEPDHDTREAFYERRKKFCRTRCKSKYQGKRLREVFWKESGKDYGSSDCISNELYKNVLRYNSMKGLDETLKVYSCESEEYTDKVDDRPECVDAKYVKYIIG